MKAGVRVAVRSVHHVNIRAGAEQIAQLRRFYCEQPFIDRQRARGAPYAVSHVPVLDDVQVLFRDPLGTGVELTVTARR